MINKKILSPPLPTCFTPTQHKKHAPAMTSSHLHKRMHKHTFIFFSVKMIHPVFFTNGHAKTPLPCHALPQASGSLRKEDNKRIFTPKGLAGNDFFAYLCHRFRSRRRKHQTFIHLKHFSNVKPLRDCFHFKSRFI